MTADCSIEDNTEGKFECYDIFGDPLDHEEAQEIPDWGYCQRHCGRFHFSQPLYSVCQGDTESWSVPLDTLQCVGTVFTVHTIGLDPNSTHFIFKDSTSIVTVVRNQIQVVAKDLAEACILDTNLPADYKGHSLNAYNNVLYLCGGHRYYGKECRKFDLTNPDQGTLRNVSYCTCKYSKNVLSNIGWVNLRKMDESLEGHSSVIANGKLFIIGGRKTDGRYSNQIYTLDLNDENARWQPHRLIGPDGSYSSYGACAVYLEEKIYLIGGVL